MLTVNQIDVNKIVDNFLVDDIVCRKFGGRRTEHETSSGDARDGRGLL